MAGVEMKKKAETGNSETVTALGGIRTVEDIRMRCYCDADTGCWHWRGAMSQGSPRIHAQNPTTGKRSAVNGRKAALWLARGRDLQHGLVAFATDDCDSTDCVNPTHCRAVTRATMAKVLKALGRTSTAKKRASAARAGKLRRKLTDQQAETIRMRPDLTLEKVAELVGCHPSTAWSIRTRRTYAPQAVSSVWGLA